MLWQSVVYRKARLKNTIRPTTTNTLDTQDGIFQLIILLELQEDPGLQVLQQEAL